jgi:hypothetical protein
VDQRGGEFRREEALMAVANLSISDPEFLNGLKADQESTLWRYGFALSPQEMREVGRYFSDKAGFRDEEIVGDLREQLDSSAEFRIWRFS